MAPLDVRILSKPGKNPDFRHAKALLHQASSGTVHRIRGGSPGLRCALGGTHVTCKNRPFQRGLEKGYNVSAYTIRGLPFVNLTFPRDTPLTRPGFTFGVATSSFQIEGSHGRLPCIWDRFSEQPGHILDGSNGIVACDHINRLDEDLDLMSWLGIDAYRFSICWSRVILEDGSVNERGMDFYRRLLDGLQRRDIKAYATLYHWELPQFIEDLGGWLNRDTAGRFQDYTAAVCRRLGRGVHAWATLNEPWCSAWLGYGVGMHAPGRSGQGLDRQAGHHLLLAHGMGLDVLRSECPGAEKGIVLNFSPCVPATDTPEDRAAARRADDYHFQWYMKPIMQGVYPDLLAELPEAERPRIEPGDLELISQNIDFLGINYYTRNCYRAGGETGFEEVDPVGPLTAMGWEVYPQGLHDLLVDLDARYELPPLYICENGAAFDDALTQGAVEDPLRIRYLQQHLEALAEAMTAGVDVRGYFYWSLLDNFEWAEGYSKRFGIVYVDFESGARIPKRSALVYRDFLRSRTGILPVQSSVQDDQAAI